MELTKNSILLKTCTLNLENLRAFEYVEETDPSSEMSPEFTGSGWGDVSPLKFSVRGMSP